MPFMVSYVRSDDEAGKFGGEYGASYGPYDRPDPLGAMVAYMADPEAGWVSANAISRWRVADDETSAVFAVESNGDERYCLIRDDETGKVLMSRGNVPEGVL